MILDLLSRIRRNRTLYYLGVTLVEIWYGEPIEEIQKPEDGPSDTGDVLRDGIARWNTADRLQRELYGKAVSRYAEAVRGCLRCDFGRVTGGFNDEDFQDAVYNGVVCELESLLSL